MGLVVGLGLEPVEAFDFRAVVLLGFVILEIADFEGWGGLKAFGGIV